MPFRFSKSWEILPGVRVRLNKKSASVRLGTRGAGRTYSTNGTVTDSVNLPGPLSWRRSRRARKGQQ